jgi:DNA topoisomerase-1
MKLFIVESPNKCSKLRKFLGSDFKLAASVGHIRAIPPKGMNIDIKGGFIPVFEVPSDKKKVVKELQSLAKEADTIYLATDPDREGEAIAWHIYDVLDAKSKKKCTRVTFNEISKSAVEKSLKDAREINMNWVNAQKARQVLDRLIGYKISPMLWYTVSSGTSAGRVQSIALKIVCEREKEILAFKPQDFWYIDALLQCEKGEFWSRVVTKDKDNRYLDDKVSNDDFEKLKKASYKLDSIERKEKKVDAYPPFDTSTLGTTCSTVFGWPIKKTAALSQSLYEKGKVTYIRTDSFNISQEAMDEVRAFIKKSVPAEYLSEKPLVYAKKASAKVASQEAHECIRPTHCDDKGDDLDIEDEQKLYKLIRSRFVACQMSPMVVDTLAYKIKTDTKHNLIAKGQTIKFDGWYKVYKYIAAKEEVLPDAKEGENLKLKDIKRTKHSTQPPPRYNEGSLVKKMEGEGVGRPSTYASIMESIKKRGYVETPKGKKGALAATALGMKVFDYLQPNFKDFFMDVGFTATVEEDLDKIRDGEKDYLGVVTNVYNIMQEEIKKARGSTTSPDKMDVSTGEKCTVCDKGSIVKKHGKFGDFFACDQYPTCKTVYVKSEDDKFVIKEKKESTAEKTDVKCFICKKGTIVKRKGEYGDWYACNNYPACKTVYIEEDGKFSVKKKFKKSSGSSGSSDSGDSDDSSDSGDSVEDAIT